MINETRYLLDALLQDWHRWARGFSPVAEHHTSPVFGYQVNSRQWDSEDDVLDGHLHNAKMKAVDFHISELQPLYRTAIDIQARNLCTGKSVWTSARLPKDVDKRALIIAEARNQLLQRLMRDGVL